MGGADSTLVLQGQPGDEPAHTSARRLLARAKRLPRATVEMASVHGRLASGLQGDGALSFQVQLDGHG